MAVKLRPMKKLAILFLFAFVVTNAFGCASARRRSGNGIASQLAKIFSSGDSNDDASVIVGFKTLEDKRPKQDISYLTSIKEKVSEEVLKTIKDTQLFDEIHSPALENDKIIISGEIRKFNVESIDTMISYIPGLNVLPFLGLPSTRVQSEVEIYIEFKNKKANAVILGFVESYKKDKKFNIYNFQPEKTEAELADCFGVVLNRVKQKIIFNKSNILEAAKLGVPEPAKQIEVKEVIAEPEVAPEAKPEIKPEAPPQAKEKEIPVVKPEETTAKPQEAAATEAPPAEKTAEPTQ